MHWIYIIKCENNIAYIGETKNLFSRLNQHMTKRGSKHTVENQPVSLCGLYKVHTHYRLLQYCREIEKEEPDVEKIHELMDEFNMVEWNNKDWARIIEDYMTENLLQYDDINVFGGKYVNDNKHELEKNFSIKEVNKVPLCKCNFPAEVRMMNSTKYYKLYFTCCMKNVWPNMREEYKKLPIDEGCSFYQEFTDGIEYRIKKTA